ncbi:MAG: DUF1700 domain-containing protein [Oscillospiraceae bacterium]|nr:DUF1700 domain-containing protein [Oscillospiraceae bacterium]
MNKETFMNELTRSLSEYGVNDSREILLDFEQHFEDGKAAGETEDEVCEKLGDPVEIAKQYISEADIKVEEKETKQSGFDSNNYSQPYTQPQQPTPPPVQQPQGFSPDAGKIIGILCVDIFVFSWALPSLISLIVGLYGCAVGFGAAAIGSVIGGTVMQFIDISSWFFTTLSPVSTILFGITLGAICALLVIASIAATRGFINVVKHIINWHSEVFAGKKVCTINNKKNKTGEAE